MSRLGAGKIGPTLFAVSLDIKERCSSVSGMSIFSIGTRGRGNAGISAGGLLSVFPPSTEPPPSCLRSVLICFLMTYSNVTMCPSSFSVRSVTNPETKASFKYAKLKPSVSFGDYYHKGIGESHVLVILELSLPILGV